MSDSGQKLIKFALLAALAVPLIAGCGLNQLNQPSADITLLTTESQLVEIQKKSAGRASKAIFEHGIYFGTVTELLPPDLKGLQHQHFMVKLSGPKFIGEIVKIAHNTDHAPTVPVKIGSSVEIKGDLITNASPKVLHWTHRTRDNHPHPHGYIRFNDEIYH